MCMKDMDKVSSKNKLNMTSVKYLISNFSLESVKDTDKANIVSFYRIKDRSKESYLKLSDGIKENSKDKNPHFFVIEEKLPGVIYSYNKRYHFSLGLRINGKVFLFDPAGRGNIKCDDDPAEINLLKTLGDCFGADNLYSMVTDLQKDQENCGIFVVEMFERLYNKYVSDCYKSEKLDPDKLSSYISGYFKIEPEKITVDGIEVSFHKEKIIGQYEHINGTTNKKEMRDIHLLPGELLELSQSSQYLNAIAQVLKDKITKTDKPLSEQQMKLFEEQINKINYCANEIEKSGNKIGINKAINEKRKILENKINGEKTKKIIKEQHNEIGLTTADEQTNFKGTQTKQKRFR